MDEPATPLAPLPWQAALWRDLMGRVAAGRLPHALLFTGPQGIGKRHLALTLARALLCESPVEEGGACGACRSCTLFAAGSHPDLLAVEPLEEGKALVVDQVRAAARFQGLAGQYSPRRVILLAPADRLNVNAANALLKTLEEPTDGTVLLLCTARPSSLLPTIRSRCQQLLLPPVYGEPATSWLREQLDGADDPDVLLSLSAGAPLGALALIAEGYLERREALLHTLESLPGADPVAAAAPWAKDEPDRVLRWLAEWLADMLRLKAAPSGARLSHPDLRARLHALGEPVDLAYLFQMADQARKARRLAAGQVNKELLFEEFFIAWSERLRPPAGLMLSADSV